MRISFITADYVARESGYAMRPFDWGAADRATQDAFHGPRFAEKFDELASLVRSAGFSAIDLWVAHLNPHKATDVMVDEARAILRRHGLELVAYTAGLGRPDMSRAEAERVYAVAKALGAPVLGVGLHPSNMRLAYDLGKEYGIKYAIENHPERTPAEILARMGRYDEWIGVAQDTGFWGQFGYDAVKATYELKDHLFHMHLKQVRRRGDGWETCSYEDGVVDIKGVAIALKELGYNGAVSVENEPHDRDPFDEVKRSGEQLRAWLGASAQ